MKTETDENLIGKIHAVYDELVKLKVYPKVETLSRMTDEQLAEEFEAVSDQLRTRKRFLGVKGKHI